MSEINNSFPPINNPEEQEPSSQVQSTADVAPAQAQDIRNYLGSARETTPETQAIPIIPRNEQDDSFEEAVLGERGDVDDEPTKKRGRVGRAVVGIALSAGTVVGGVAAYDHFASAQRPEEAQHQVDSEVEVPEDSNFVETFGECTSKKTKLVKGEGPSTTVYAEPDTESEKFLTSNKEVQYGAWSSEDPTDPTAERFIYIKGGDLPSDGAWVPDTKLDSAVLDGACQVKQDK